MRRILSLLCPLVLLFSGCVQEELQTNESAPLDGRIFTASFEQDQTRTYLEDGNLLRWNAGDQISLFDGNTLNRQYQFDGETGDNSGTFSIVDKPYGTGNALNANYAVYPYAFDVKISEGGVITAMLPSVQNYAENSFGLGANTMVAVTKDVDDTFLKFKNTCGYLKLQLYGEDVTVKSITLTGNNNEKIAGKATIAPAYGQSPTLAMSDDAKTSITLDCGEGVKIGATEETATAFWIVVPPITFEEGLTITIKEIDGKSFIKSTSNAVVVERNIIKPMAAFDVVIEKIPNNQIWYTSTDGQIVEPYSDEGFGAYIVSNTYENGKGIITFNGDITMIGKWAFDRCFNLKSIIIPDGVVLIDSYAFNVCSSLTNVTIPDSVIMINFWGFAHCTSLTNIIIPDSVTTIEERAFLNCESLKDVTIGNNVTWIGDEAFCSCHSLTSITIPNSVTTIGESVFNFCDNLKEFKGKFISDDGRCLIIDGILKAFAPAGLTEYTIPNSVTSIGDFAFYCCNNLTSVTIPDSVTTIGESAFAANGFTSSSLTTITIPDSVTSIGSYAFVLCDNLKSVTIGKSITTIGDGVFSDCYRLSIVYCKAINPPLMLDMDKDWGVFFANASGRKIFVPRGSVDSYKRAKGWSNYASDIVGYDF